MAGGIPTGDVTVKITEKDGFNDGPYGSSPVDTVMSMDPLGSQFRNPTQTVMGSSTPPQVTPPQYGSQMGQSQMGGQASPSYNPSQ